LNPVKKRVPEFGVFCNNSGNGFVGRAIRGCTGPGLGWGRCGFFFGCIGVGLFVESIEERFF